MPKRIMKVTGYSGGIEESLPGWGGFVIAIGVIGFIASLMLQLNAGQFDFFMMSIGITLLFQGLIGGVLLRAGAEVIRLLKKLNGLDFSGQISPVSPIEEYTCSACGSSSAYRHRCFECQEEFDQTNVETDDGY